LPPARPSTGTGVELSEDARFNIHFWAEQAESDQPLFHSRKA
jgi:hypothetical protein